MVVPAWRLLANLEQEKEAGREARFSSLRSPQLHDPMWKHGWLGRCCGSWFQRPTLHCEHDVTLTADSEVTRVTPNDDTILYYCERRQHRHLCMCRHRAPRQMSLFGYTKRMSTVVSGNNTDTSTSNTNAQSSGTPGEGHSLHMRLRLQFHEPEWWN